MLSFGKANAKHEGLTNEDFARISTKYSDLFGSVVPNLKNFYTFSLPAGWTCPGANLCLAKADQTTGRITDGPNQAFRCYAASMEALYPTVRDSRWSNFEQLRRCKDVFEMETLINASIPLHAQIVRVHVSGDFFNKDYLKAWLNVATLHKPKVLFYAYTKSVHYLNEILFLPRNFIFTVSGGGKFDSSNNRFGQANVVFEDDGKLDHNDLNAITGNTNFSLLIHGTQPKGSYAAAARSKMRKRGYKV